MRNLLALLLLVPSLCLSQIPDYVPTDGLVAWYPFNGNANDVSGTGNDGVNQGVIFTEDRFNMPNSAGYFNGSSYIEIDHSESLDIPTGQDISWSVWVWTTPQSSPGSAFEKWDNYAGTDYTQLMLRRQANGEDFISAGYCANPAQTGTGVVSATTTHSEWHHFALSTSSDITNLYVDGTLVSTSTIIESGCTNSNVLHIGHRPGSSGRYYTGKIDDFGVWNRALNEGEIQALFLSTPLEYGCADTLACNFTSELTIPDDNFCIYPGACESCNPDGSVTLHDDDSDGVCNEDEILGCTDMSACNFNPSATEENGYCNYCQCEGVISYSDITGYGLEVDTVATDIGLVSDGLGNTIDLSGYNTYRLYVTMANADDFMNAVSGDASNTTNLSTTTSFYQDLIGGVTPTGLNPVLFSFYPSLIYDSYVTIGLESSPVAGEGTISFTESPDYPWTADFDPGNGLPGGSFTMEDTIGGIWYALSGDANGVAGDDLKVLIAQLTTDGNISGNLYCQILEHGDGVNGTLNPTLFFVSPNSCGCTDPTACNYDNNADQDDGSCITCDFIATFCGEGTMWDNTLGKCVSICPPQDTTFTSLPSCGEGTVWDPVNEECIIAIPADLNFDGCVTINDLLVLLTVHGTCPPFPEWPDQPTDTTWTCGDPVTYWDFDYATVLIGDQCWFAENLRTEQYANSDSISANLTDTEWTSTTTGATSVFGEGSSACYHSNPDIDACDEAQSLAQYGRVYNWYAVDDSRGICPSGWHAPTDEEWFELEDYITSQGFDGTEGTALKSTTGWNNGGNGTDDFGFSGIPGGYRTWTGYFSDAGYNGYWWSSSPNEGYAWYRYLNSVNPDIGRPNDYPQAGFSVRCMKD